MSFQSPNYTQVPNDLFDEIMSDMDGSELKVVLCIVRQTIGYHREEVKFSIPKLMEMTGLSRNSVKTGAEKAKKRGLIERLNPDSQGSAEWGLSVTPSTIDDTPSEIDPSLSTVEGQSRVKESIKENKDTDWKVQLEEAKKRKKEKDAKKKDPVTEILKAHRKHEPILDMRERVESALRGRKPDWDSPRSLWNGYEQKLIQREKDTGETIERFMEWFYDDEFRSKGYIYLKPTRIDDLWSAAFDKPKQEQVEYFKPEEGEYVPNPNS